VAFYNEYMRFCKKDNVADFNSLSKYVVGMLSADKMRPLSITHLIVDEVQDTDGIQFTWISEHAKRGSTPLSLEMMTRQSTASEMQGS
jgi:superfamily I DNA/RNA helicase